MRKFLDHLFDNAATGWESFYYVLGLIVGGWALSTDGAGWPAIWWGIGFIILFGLLGWRRPWGREGFGLSMLFVETDSVTVTGDEIRVGNQILPFARVERILQVEGGIEVWYWEAA